MLILSALEVIPILIDPTNYADLASSIINPDRVGFRLYTDLASSRSKPGLVGSDYYADLANSMGAILVMSDLTIMMIVPAPDFLPDPFC